MECIVFLIHYINYTLKQNGIHLPEHYKEYLNLGILQMSRYGLNLKLEMCL